MFHLRVLGQVDLRDPVGREVTSVLVQPKRLALLTYLVASRPQQRMHRRDALLALFWPDIPESRARSSLRQALHQLRRALGPDVVTTRGADSLAVNPAAIECDAAEFENALDRGRLADALLTYGGELLPAFSIDGLAAFNEWLDETRLRLRNRAARAGWALAEQQERCGDMDAAAASARRAAELTVDDERALRQLMSLLDRARDVTGAIRVYEDFAARLRRDLDLEPSPESRALYDSMRASSRPGATSAAGTIPPIARTVVVPDGSQTGGSARPNARPSVGVSSFDNLTGNPELDFVGRLASSAVSQAVAETRLVDVVAADGVSDGVEVGSSGRNEGRRLVVVGTYHIADDAWHMQASLRLAHDSRVIGTISRVVARRDRPWEAAHEMGRRMSGLIAAHVDTQMASWADVVAAPPSIDAHRAHLHGIELHLRGEYRAAISQFLRAANPDVGFTVPLLWAATASCNLEEYEQATAIVESLSAYRGRLSPAERLGAEYFEQWLAGDRLSALRTLGRVAELVPDSEVLAQLGRDAMLCNNPRYAVEVLERVDPERGWMPSWTPYWQRLTEAYHMVGDHGRELDAARRGRRQHPEAMGPLLYEARAHAALGDADAVSRIVDEAVALGSDRFMSAGEVLFTAARELKAHGNVSMGVDVLARAVHWQCDRSAVGPLTISDRLALARMHYEAEQWPEAAELLSQIQREEPENADVLGAAGALAARVGNEADARTALAALRAKTGRFRFGKHLLWAARIAAVLGDASSALSLLRGAFARGCGHDVSLHTDIDLSCLTADERYRALLRPRG
ncbi:MAG TPA: BTAD domain-containing putative transcriptional regulator [Gemmatimonadaceae bacterium]|nr:BTAD domain-containing putative transcriptional regulator [Gemmatimonadaceae bacterium]